MNLKNLTKRDSLFVIEHNLDEVAKELKATAEAILKAEATTLNKMAERAKTTGVRAITDNYNIKRGELVNTSTGGTRFNIIRAARGDGFSELRISGRPISLTYFGAKQTTKGSKSILSRYAKKEGKRESKFSGVTVKIMKGGKTNQFAGSFIATVKAGGRGTHIGVFQHGRPKEGKRKWGQPQLHIEERAMVSIPSMFKNERVLPLVEKRVNEDMPKVFRHELERLLGKKL